MQLAENIFNKYVCLFHIMILYSSKRQNVSSYKMNKQNFSAVSPRRFNTGTQSTGKSPSEAFILTSTNLQYDDRLLIVQ